MIPYILNLLKNKYNDDLVLFAIIAVLEAEICCWLGATQLAMVDRDKELAKSVGN